MVNAMATKRSSVLLRTLASPGDDERSRLLPGIEEVACEEGLGGCEDDENPFRYQQPPATHPADCSLLCCADARDVQSEANAL